MDNALDRVIIAAPCPVSWDSMLGDDRVRHCSGCSRNVYNVSDMTQAEAQRFFQENGSSQCVTLYRRADGKVMTDNCPRGLRAIRNKFKLIVKVIAGCAASFLACVPIGRWQSASAQPAEQAAQQAGAQAGHENQPGVQTPGQQQQPTQKQLQKFLRGKVYIPPAKGTDPNAANNGAASAPKLLGGEPVIIAPAVNSDKSNHKQIMMNGDCPDGKTKITEKEHDAEEKDLRDNRAYKLYQQAKQNDEAGKLLLAQTQYQQALNIALQAKTADPKFIILLTNALAKVKSRIDTPVYSSVH
jgi:hypothetical protein